MTSDQERRLNILRSVLPLITSDLSVLGCLGPCALDCEWDRTTGELTLIGVGNDTIIVQIRWAAFGDDEFSKHEVRTALEGLVRRTTVVYQNGVADTKKLLSHGFKVWPSDHFDIQDTMLMDAVLNAEMGHSLDELCERYGKLPRHKDLELIDTAVYNAVDVLQTFFVWRDGLVPLLRKDTAAELIYSELSLPFLKEIQLETELAGIRIDKSKPYALYDKYDLKRKQAALLAQAYCGFPINLRSSDDLKHWLYTVEGLPEQYDKNPTERKLTTDKDAIAALRRWHGTEFDPDEPPTLEEANRNIAEGGHPLLEARYLMMGAQQAISHYIEPCLEISPKGELLGVRDRIYPEIRQHVQASGRHSFVGPAVQQMKFDVLEQLTPDPGTVWVSFDWSQIEVRLLAVLAGDQPYLDAFARGDDIHDLNKRTLFADKYQAAGDFGEVQRRFTKTFVFRLHYRGKPENAGDIPGARLLGLDRERLVEVAGRYMDAHPAIPDYWRRLEDEIERRGVVYTFMGRPRRLTSPWRNARIREGCNHPCQGGVSDVYTSTAVAIKRAAPWARFVYGAHDAQTWQVPKDRAEEFRALIEPIVTREFDVHGVPTRFPAEFKAVRGAA